MNRRLLVIFLGCLSIADSSRKDRRAKSPERANVDVENTFRPSLTGLVAYREDENGITIEAITPRKVPSELRARIREAIERLTKTTKVPVNGSTADHAPPIQPLSSAPVTTIRPSSIADRVGPSINPVHGGLDRSRSPETIRPVYSRAAFFDPFTTELSQPNIALSPPATDDGVVHTEAIASTTEEYEESEAATVVPPGSHIPGSTDDRPERSEPTPTTATTLPGTHTVTDSLINTSTVTQDMSHHVASMRTAGPRLNVTTTEGPRTNNPIESETRRHRSAHRKRQESAADVDASSARAVPFGAIMIALLLHVTW